jgi:hypothetical protein
VIDNPLDLAATTFEIPALEALRVAGHPEALRHLQNAQRRKGQAVSVEKVDDRWQREAKSRKAF